WCGFSPSRLELALAAAPWLCRAELSHLYGPSLSHLCTICLTPARPLQVNSDCDFARWLVSCPQPPPGPGELGETPRTSPRPRRASRTRQCLDEASHSRGRQRGGKTEEEAGIQGSREAETGRDAGRQERSRRTGQGSCSPAPPRRGVPAALQAPARPCFREDLPQNPPPEAGASRSHVAGSGPFPGIIDLYGTGGGLPEYRACLLANHGFAVLALAFYSYEDLPKQMKEFHLEYFEEAVNYMLHHTQVKGPGIGLLGHSKGGDLCVSMASFLKGITATALINASVANVGAVLRYKDITIPPLGMNPKRVKVGKSGIADIIDALNSPLEGPDQQSFIPLEKAQCCFLFIVGQDDHNWKSEFFAVEGSKRLQAHGKEKPEIVCYPGAGHYIEPPFFPMCAASMHLLFGKPVMWGGEPKAHCEAQIDAWQQIQAFFRKHLTGEPSGTSSRL
uniref:BAAT/Acyl-CoA thioester hydrolase C-terminal domain-containing protein n=1 Tax=Junco hyemalis TaxID=40217 RepID=A0A8C5IMC4_JUNHY